MTQTYPHPLARPPFVPRIASHARLITVLVIAVLALSALPALAAPYDRPVDAEPLGFPDQMRGTTLSDPDDALAAPTSPAPASQSTGPIATGTLPPPAAALLRIAFKPNDATLDDVALGDIVFFAGNLKSRGGRVALKAYAGEPGASGSNARRLALRRVLAVREQLVDQGIAPERLTVYALGGVKDSGNPDRVDIVQSGR